MKNGKGELEGGGIWPSDVNNQILKRKYKSMNLFLIKYFRFKGILLPADTDRYVFILNKLLQSNLSSF